MSAPPAVLRGMKFYAKSVQHGVCLLKTTIIRQLLATTSLRAVSGDGGYAESSEGDRNVILRTRSPYKTLGTETDRHDLEQTRDA
eukprot:6206930-Pleurochrysis_carterae.AAC.3